MVALCELVLVPSVASAAIARFALAVGNDAGAAGEVRLKFAQRDARRVHDVLVQLGSVAPDDAVLLTEQSPDAVLAELAALEQKVRARIDGGDQVVLFVYYSGHADASGLHLGDRSLPYRELVARIQSSAADVRLLVVDACRSGGATRRKGLRKSSPIRLQIDEKLAGEGFVLLTSTAQDEDAQETDALQGSFFTHYLISGLRGGADDDQDLRVTLGEAYRYAYERTLKRTSETLAGPQHPSFQYDLRAQGDVVLTRLATAAQGTLVFPEGRSYLVLRGGRDGDVVGEIGEFDRSRTLMVRPGRYFIRGRARSFLLEGRVQVTQGSSQRVPDSELRRIGYDRVVRKGGADRRYSHGIGLGYRLQTARVPKEGLCHGIGAGYIGDTRHLRVGVRFGYCRRTFANESLSAKVDEYDLEFRLGHVFDVRQVSFQTGFVGGVGLVHQTFETTGMAPPRIASNGHIGALGQLLISLPRGFALVGEVALLAQFIARPSGTASKIEPAFVVRPWFGVNKHW